MTNDQVRNLARLIDRVQANPWLHPMTCPNHHNHLNERGKYHAALIARLTADSKGWYFDLACPVCDYVQNWIPLQDWTSLAVYDPDVRTLPW